MADVGCRPSRREWYLRWGSASNASGSKIIWSGAGALSSASGSPWPAGLAWWVVDDLGSVGSCLLTGASGRGRLRLLIERIEPDGISVTLHAALMDRAGWHIAKDLAIPANLTPLFLPPYSPELNAIERVWLYLRERFLSHRLWPSCDASFRGGWRPYPASGSLLVRLEGAGDDPADAGIPVVL